MARILHPPVARFDPITARWLTPGGPLHDPQRDSFDPEHREPVTLVGSVPQELVGTESSRTGDNAERRTPVYLRRRRVTLAVFWLFIIAVIVGGILV